MKPVDSLRLSVIASSIRELESMQRDASIDAAEVGRQPLSRIEYAEKRYLDGVAAGIGAAIERLRTGNPNGSR